MVPRLDARGAALTLLICVLLGGCEAQVAGFGTYQAGPGVGAPISNGSVPPVTTPDAGYVPPVTTPDAGYVPPVTTPDAGTPPPVTPTVTPYPTGPFGAYTGEVMQDYAFTRIDGTATSLSQLRSDPNVKVILWVSSVEWCSFCRQQVPTLNSIAQRYGSSGVVIISSLYETSSYTPATQTTANDWQTQLGCQYDVIVEPNPPYLQHDVNPTAWIIDAETMRIGLRMDGEDPQIESRVTAALAASTR